MGVQQSCPDLLLVAIAACIRRCLTNLQLSISEVVVQKPYQRKLLVIKSISSSRVGAQGVSQCISSTGYVKVTDVKYETLLCSLQLIVSWPSPLYSTTSEQLSAISMYNNIDPLFHPPSVNKLL